MAKSDGTAAVGAEILRAAAAVGATPAAEQLTLLPPLPSEMNATTRERAVAAVEHDRRGRPPGARNVATREMLDFVRRTMGDPLERRFHWAMHTPESLAIALGCTRLEAYDRLDRLWGELARYFYATQAQVDGQGNAVVPRLTMTFGGHSAGVPGIPAPGQPPWMYLDAVVSETQQNQALLATPESRSHGEGSHGSE